MLACSLEDISELRLPCYASIKLDGIRITITEDGPKTRTLKQVPNNYARNLLQSLPPGLDGECGVIVDGILSFRESTSALMSEDGEPDIRFFIFDNYLYKGGFEDRYSSIQKLYLPDWCEIVEHNLLTTLKEVEELFIEVLHAGHEGLIFRSIDSEYKFGRSTPKQQGMIKYKPWEDTEGVCIGYEEEMQNNNPKQVNELGRTKRSSSKLGLISKGTMGKLLVKSLLWPDEILEIGSGFSKEERKSKDWVGKIIKFKYTPTGNYNKPRQPIYLGIRDERDL